MSLPVIEWKYKVGERVFVFLRGDDQEFEQAFNGYRILRQTALLGTPAYQLAAAFFPSTSHTNIFAESDLLPVADFVVLLSEWHPRISMIIIIFILTFSHLVIIFIYSMCIFYNHLFFLFFLVRPNLRMLHQSYLADMKRINEHLDKIPIMDSNEHCTNTIKEQ